MHSDRDSRTYAIIGAAIEVHRRLGVGFLEGVYQEALTLELQDRGIPFRRQVEIPVHYKQTRLRCSYRADFVCFESVILELKALRSIGGSEEAQVINYLKASNLQIALLLNFGTLRLEHKRFILSGQTRK